MTIEITFTPGEEARLAAASESAGLAPAELIKRLTLENLPAAESVEDILYAKLRERQERDGTPLMPDVSAHELFARWAEEAAQMTEEEREAENRLSDEIERAILENRGLELRRPGE